jgi:DNA-binding SARP family transcriptional activator
VEFRILGPLEVVEDGNPVALGTLKERLVLAVLVLHANEFVSRERLIDDLWGVAPPPTAQQAVYVYVSKLRKALACAGSDPIATSSGGYLLHLEPDSLDASRMQALVAAAHELVAQGEPASAAARFEEALSLWRGPTLAGLQLESRGRDEVEALDELRLGALMDRIDCDLALGRHEQALTELGVLVREHPLRERPRAQQMLAFTVPTGRRTRSRPTPRRGGRLSTTSASSRARRCNASSRRSSDTTRPSRHPREPQR